MKYFKEVYRDLKKISTISIGPKAIVFEPKNIEELRNLIKKYKKNYYVIGACSNILFIKPRYKKAFISLKNFNKIGIQIIDSKKYKIFAGSGVKNNNLLKKCINNNLTGLEFFWAIPGTVGGAVFMNAGSPKNTIGKLVNSVTVLNKNNKIKKITKKQLKFSYRKSNINGIILEAELLLRKSNKKSILNKINKYKEKKIKTQPLNEKSLGCIFKNPKNCSAGKLIDSCNLKGYNIGDAQISKIHANYIINKKNATAKDVLKLMKLIQKEVYKKFKIRLEPEINII